jgi:hypothetical protein
MQQRLTLNNRVHVPLSSQPVRQGVPWPRGAVRPEQTLVAYDELDRRIDLGQAVLNCWSDGSLQWSLLDLSLDFAPSGTRVVRVAADEVAPPLPPPPYAVVATPSDRGITLGNGLTQLTILTRAGASLVEGWEAGVFDAWITDPGGQDYSAAACTDRRVWIERANPLTATVRVDGRHTASDGSTLLHYWIRFTLYSGRRDVRITYHYRNREDAEPGIRLKALTLRLRTPLPAEAQRCIMQTNRGRHFRTQPVRLGPDVELCSSNTMNLADYERTHAGLTGGGPGRVFIRDQSLLGENPADKPWFLRQVEDFKFQSDDRPEAYTWSYLGLVSDAGSVLAAGGNMIGLHPKSLRVRGSDLEYDIWPQWAGAMDMTQGEGRTLEFFVEPLPPRTADRTLVERFLSWEVSGLYAHVSAQPTVLITPDIEHIRRCSVFQVDRLPAHDPQNHFAFERKVEAVMAPSGPVPANGHWHYGDVFYRWDIGANNEEMAGHAWFQEYLRSGRDDCLRRGLAQAQHILDVDLCFHSIDPYQRGGMCAHGPRHNRCAAYPSHMWFTELLFAFALTGDEEFRAGAAMACDNLLFWINDPEGFDTIAADGRESGQPLINLAWTYAFVPEPRYLAGIDKIVRQSLMNGAREHGQLVYMKPHPGLPLLRAPGYGEWAAWEGLFYAWEITRDESWRRFILEQLQWRVSEAAMATTGSFRATDLNVAAYGFLLSGDRMYLDRVARPVRAMFRCRDWPFAYIKSMFLLKLAFEHGLIHDDDVLLS